MVHELSSVSEAGAADEALAMPTTRAADWTKGGFTYGLTKFEA